MDLNMDKLNVTKNIAESMEYVQGLRTLIIWGKQGKG